MNRWQEALGRYAGAVPSPIAIYRPPVLGYAFAAPFEFGIAAMSTAHHTPLAYGGKLTATDMEAPFGQLDAAIAAVIATGSGASTTLTAQALAGQASLTVASSAGFVVGTTIFLGKSGGTNESRVIATIPNGTTITVTVNLTNTYASGDPVTASPIEIVDARSGFATLGARLAALEPVFNVKSYGAKGDGTTDDTTAIQAAIDACEAAGGGIVYFPAGTYKVTSTLTVEATGVRLVGAGKRATVILSGLTVAGAIVTLGKSDNTTYQFIEIRDLSIDGNSSAFVNWGIRKHSGVIQWELHDVRVVNCQGSPGTGLYTDSTGGVAHYSGLVNRCHFESNNTGIGLELGATWTVIRDTLAYYNDDFGLDINRAVAVFVENCEIEENGRTANTTGSIRLRGNEFVLIRGLYSEQSTTFPGYAILVNQDILPAPCKDVLIEGARFYGNNQATKAIILHDATNLTIRNNRFLAFTTAHISYEPGAIGLVRVKEYDNSRGATGSTADHSAVQNEIVIPVAGGILGDGSPAIVLAPVGVGNFYERLAAVAFDDATPERWALPAIVVPDNFAPDTQFNIYYEWMAAAITGNVIWQVFAKVVSANEATSGASDVGTDSAALAASGTQYGLKRDLITSSVLTAGPGDTIRLVVGRSANAGGDTMTGDAWLAAVALVRKNVSIL